MHAPACSASGSGLFGGTAGYSQEFVIYTFTSLYIAAYVPGSSFRLYFKPPVDANPVLLDTSTNAVDVSYRITVVGEYQMSVLATNFSAQIRGSPFTVRITAGPLSIEKCGGYLQGGNPVLSVDKYPVFIIQQKDAFGNKIYSDNISDIHNYTITVLTSSGIPVPVEAVLNLSSSNKDEILATFNLTEVGNYTLQVGDSSGSINGIPNQISMVEGPVVTSDQCKAKFAPDGSLHRGMSLKIVITTYVAAEPTISKYALSFGITSVPPLSAEPNVFEDMKDGTYVTTIKLSSVGNFKFVIDLFGAPIAGSPFNFAIKGETTTVIHTQLDDVWTWENHQITFNVLTNDYSIPAVPLILVHMTPPIGIFTMSENGTVVYNPSENFTGFLRVTYEVEAETGETSFGDVFITVVSQQQPYISAYPKSLVGLEDQPLPPVGAIQNLEVVSLEPEMVISAELSALHGRIYPAAGMSGNWSMVTVVLSNDVSLPPENVSGDGTTEALYDETGPLLKAWGEMAIQNDESHALRFSATLERMNSALKALQYVGLQNFNGEDTVSFSVHNGRGLGCTKTISVYVWPVNDPPFVTGPSFISIHLSNETTGENLTQFGVPITNLSVGDPDADDASGSMYALAGVLQLEKGQFGITIPNSSSASYVTPGARNWSLVSDPQVTIWAQSVRFKASIPDWNAALQGLVLKTDNVNRQKLGLSLLIDDMGQFGVGGDWSRTSPYPYVIQYQTVIMIYEIGYKSPFRLKAFVKFILYAMGGIVGMVGVFYLAGKLGLQYYLPRWKGKSAEEDEEKNYKMIRVYNPLWLPTYQKAETTTGLEPTGSGFEIQQDWKMETMQAPDVMPPLGNESMPLDISSGGTDTSQQETEPGNPSQGGLSARKFSVKWSADAGMGNSGSSVRGTEITSEMFVLGEQDVTSPRSPDILPDVSFWQEVVTDFTPPSPGE
ncbi:hypothetical protein R1sor_026348 [Riccia sorocarpa]|uniref:GEX2 N-terminal Ig-like domain-containing protein n=1 Tax=Riccia sorocarpa TaxID=122646 RepID=A0ABD3GE76_9MARC